MGIKVPSDWYTLKTCVFRDARLSGLLKVYDDSLHSFLKASFPKEYEQLLPWLFEGGAPSGYWSDDDNLRSASDFFRKDYGVQTPTDWYGLCTRDFTDRKLSTLLDAMGGSPQTFVASMFPDDYAELQPWQFASGVPQAYWQCKDNRMKAAAHIKHTLRVCEATDWYQVTQQKIFEAGLVGFLTNCYQSSPQRFVEACYPAEYSQLLPWLFVSGVPRGFWECDRNRNWALAWIKLELKVTAAEDWYNVEKSDFVNRSLSGLLKCYGGSVQNLHSSLCPEEYVHLLPWRFKGGAPQSFWKSQENICWAANVLEAELRVTRPEDWYVLTAESFRSSQLHGLLGVFGGSPKAFLRAARPTEYGRLDPRKFCCRYHETCMVDAVQRHEHFSLLGADAVDRATVKFVYPLSRADAHLLYGCSSRQEQAIGYWDALLCHVPTGSVGPVEVDGEQHFVPIRWSLGITEEEAGYTLMRTRRRDALKSCVALTKHAFLLRVSYASRAGGASECTRLLDALHQQLRSGRGQVGIAVDRSEAYQTLQKDVTALLRVDDPIPLLQL